MVRNTHNPPLTPDRRYFVVRGRLRRAPNPYLPPIERTWLEAELTVAQREVARAKKRSDPALAVEARASVAAAKQALGLTGPPWWTDGSPDLSRYLVRNTDYADWFKSLALADEPVA